MQRGGKTWGNLRAKSGAAWRPNMVRCEGKSRRFVREGYAAISLVKRGDIAQRAGIALSSAGKAR